MNEITNVFAIFLSFCFFRSFIWRDGRTELKGIRGPSRANADYCWSPRVALSLCARSRRYNVCNTLLYCSAGNIRPAPHLNAAEKQKRATHRVVALTTYTSETFIHPEWRRDETREREREKRLIYTADSLPRLRLPRLFSTSNYTRDNDQRNIQGQTPRFEALALDGKDSDS